MSPARSRPTLPAGLACNRPMTSLYRAPTRRPWPWGTMTSRSMAAGEWRVNGSGGVETCGDGSLQDDEAGGLVEWNERPSAAGKAVSSRAGSRRQLSEDKSCFDA
jgi:hypothetical protein